MDCQLRLLTAELINLQEECNLQEKKKILSELKRHQKTPTADTVSSDKSKQLSPIGRITESVKQLLGADVVSIWLIIFFFVVFLWWPHLWTYQALSDDIVRTFHEVSKNSCVVDIPQFLMEFGRPTFNCNLCRELKEFPVEKRMTRTRFLQKFAYSGIPVLVKGSISDWKAFKTFSYEWFQDTYDNFTDAFEIQDTNGQFFPYKTEFQDLEEALHMSQKRMNESWYFGWSNAHPAVGSILRKQYRRPDFLPDGSDSSLDWMFMGTSGKGANIHLDNVNRPSWQAQIQGKKTWYLVPTPECQSVCHPINATMSPGDIIVVDTNIWYHGTEIWPGDISITIGSEYD